MAKSYKLSPLRRVVNRMLKTALGLGIGPKEMAILTVRGRKSGNLISTPVSLVEENGTRWLVAPYGEVGWVKNARAAGEVTIRRGRKIETLKIIELNDPKESASILKKYVQVAPITRPYFDTHYAAPAEAFANEAAKHPVFKLG